MNNNNNRHDKKQHGGDEKNYSDKVHQKQEQQDSQAKSGGFFSHYWERLLNVFFVHEDDFKDDVQQKTLHERQKNAQKYSEDKNEAKGRTIDNSSRNNSAGNNAGSSSSSGGWFWGGVLDHTSEVITRSIQSQIPTEQKSAALGGALVSGLVGLYASIKLVGMYIPKASSPEALTEVHKKFLPTMRRRAYLITFFGTPIATFATLVFSGIGSYIGPVAYRLGSGATRKIGTIVIKKPKDNEKQ